MADYLLMISGVHYGANGDYVAGQKDTEADHARTLELLGWIHSERPIVVLMAEDCNPIHKPAIIAQAENRRIGRVARTDLPRAWDLMNQSGRTMLTARVVEVAVQRHGYVIVAVRGGSALESKPPTSEIDWQSWMSTEPLLPASRQWWNEQEAAIVLEQELLPALDTLDIGTLRKYLDMWIENSWHDLSLEAIQKRTYFIRQLEAAEDKQVRQLAEPLKEQHRRLLERERIDALCTTWWRERLESREVGALWQRWKLKNDNRLWAGLRCIDALLRKLPGELYGDIGRLDVVMARLYYLNTPLRAFQGIMALIMLRQLTCRELGIDMRPMTEADYGIDGMITNLADMPTTIGRVMAYAAEQCRTQEQQQSIQNLTYWLRDDYQQQHQKEIEQMVEDRQGKLVEALEHVAGKDSTTVIANPGSSPVVGCQMPDATFTIGLQAQNNDKRRIANGQQGELPAAACD